MRFAAAPPAGVAAAADRCLRVLRVAEEQPQGRVGAGGAAALDLQQLGERDLLLLRAVLHEHPLRTPFTKVPRENAASAGRPAAAMRALRPRRR